MTDPSFTAHVGRAAPATGQVGSTRERILEASVELFAARGFHATTVRDIAEAARVNVAAINYHFRSKDELHGAVIETVLMRWSSEIVALDDLAPEAGLEQAISCIVAALVEPVIERQENGAVLRLLAWAMLEQPGRQGAGQGVGADGFALALAQCLKPHLPPGTAAAERLFLAHWLIGQCLLLSPALRSPHLPGGPSGDIVARVTRLALQGLAAQGPAPHGPATHGLAAHGLASQR
jgi:AcrR family transcriptional regulator